MPSASLAIAANICQATVPFISLLAYAPQWLKLWRTKSSTAISIRSWCAWSLSSAFALFYALTQLHMTGRGWALVMSTSLGLCFVLCTLWLVVKYRERPPAHAPTLAPTFLRQRHTTKG
ncbi:MAG: PQ-loop repeat-containing protein [bacterium]|nr:PQ-loop repeat-containing protein [bacterium]